MATVISGEFQIVTDLVGGTGTTNLATSRPMRVVSILGTGSTSATITVQKISAAGAVTAIGVVTVLNAAGGGDDSLTDQAGVMQPVANCTLLATDTLRVVRGVANSTRCVLNCIAAGGEAVVES
jgi:hypothetical protein